MKLTRSLKQISPTTEAQVGGKTTALAKLQRLGYQVPVSLAIATTAYQRYLAETGLDAKILMELGRKDFSQMRWEEIWDAALRIRNLFLTTAIPKALEVELAEAFAKTFGKRPLVIRSSAPGEDSSASSFAGLHNSYVNVSGIESQLLAVRKVWASLWSDRALLYRQELGLDIKTSSMAVLVQELIAGEKSGVAFSCSPSDNKNVAVEAVFGLNQGLVDGSVEPDCWAVNRQNQEILVFRPAQRINQLIPVASGLQLVPLTDDERAQPALSTLQVTAVAQTALALEQQFGQPQDIEWTWAADQLVLLQARPITTGNQAGDDPRSWYLSLHRDLKNLQQLQVRIETEIIPGMEAAAEVLAKIVLPDLSDKELAREIERRRQIQHDWEEAYRSDCIPMAHGIRMFGEFYNDSMQPEDPFDFMELLRGTDFRAVARNQKLAEFAELIQKEQPLSGPTISANGLSPTLKTQLESLAESIGLPAEQMLKLLLELSKLPMSTAKRGNENPEINYLRHFSAEEQTRAAEILAIGRASYRLRDDDNISLDKIIRARQKAEQEAARRLKVNKSACLRKVLSSGQKQPAGLSYPAQNSGNNRLGEFTARQLQGQPASPGLATAAARVIHCQDDLAEFRAGEILVCDAIDPAMTFVVPLAAGIIERRGGMLIHGAIIAREYGIPCVSGIAAAADIINSGDQITIDGYLGLVFFPSSSGKLSLAGQNDAMRKELDDAAKS